MKQVDLADLYRSSFTTDKLFQLLNSWSQGIKKKSNQLEIPQLYRPEILSCHQQAIYSDQNGHQLPIIVVRLAQDAGQQINHFLNQFYASQLLVVFVYPSRQEWKLSLVDLDFPLPRIDYYSLGTNNQDYWFREQIGSLINQRQPSIAEFKQAFQQKKLSNHFFRSCNSLVSRLAEQLEETGAKDSFQAAKEVFLQLLVLKFIEQKDWLADSLLELHHLASANDELAWPFYCSSIFNDFFPQQDFAAYRVDNQLLFTILTTLAKYNYSLEENFPWHRELAVTPRILGDLFEDLSKEVSRKKRGVFYTPQKIVYYMCQEGVVNYLAEELDIKDSRLRNLVFRGSSDKDLKKQATKIDNKLAQIKVCDPAVGSGAFVVGMLQTIVQLRSQLNQELTTYQLKLETIKQALYGVDLDRQAVEITKLRLWLSLAADQEQQANLEPFSNLRYKYVTGNSLLTTEDNLFNSSLQPIKELKEEYQQADAQLRNELGAKLDNKLAQLTGAGFSFSFYFPEVFTLQSGFDLIIGNPPYLGEKGNKKLFRKIKKYKLGQYYTGKMDLFYFFFHLGLDLVKEQGHLALITTNYFLRATRAQKLREDLQHRSSIQQLINFNNLKLFPAARGQHNLITIARKGQRDIPAQTAVTYRQGIASPLTVANILAGCDRETNYYQVSQQLLYEGEKNYLKLEAGKVEELLATIRQQGTQLGKLATINQGIVTGCDRVSKRHLKRCDLELEAGQGVFILDQAEINDLALDPTDNRYLKPWFKNSDIDSWRPNLDNSNWLIYLDHDLPKLPADFGPHLEQFRPLLKQRREVKSATIKWWQLQWPRSKQLFTGPKIVVPQRSKSNTFAYTEQDWYASADVYFITAVDANVNLKYLLALLNSDLYYVWLDRKGKKKGNLLELYQGPLAEIPIKISSQSEQEEFIRLVEQIIGLQADLAELKKKSWSQLLPTREEEVALQDLSQQLTTIYQGQAYKVRQLQVEVRDCSGIVYSARADTGWYQVLEFKVASALTANYIKYQLESLSPEDLKTINQQLTGGLADRISQLKVPAYKKTTREQLVKKWSKIQTEIADHKQEISQIEEQINQLVYELYNLTAEDIRVIEQYKEKIM
ncbi:Eco57I restriction-modification methylase domain-containing protein [Halanaerobaculum tunisiense]